MDYLKLRCLKITVSGRVQGVGFRYFIAQIAENLALNGYAKNLFTGEVEIIAEGREEFLQELIKKAKEGPRNSRVNSCKVEWLDFQKKYNNFEIM